jgi:O-Antigen ligase
MNGRRSTCSRRPARARTTSSLSRRNLVPAAVAFAGVAAYAAVDGGFFPRWWGLGTVAFACAAAAALLIARELTVSLRSLVLVSSLAAFVAFVALSAFWATSVPLALVEVERGLVYVAAAAAGVVLGRERPDALPAGVLAAAVVVACWNLAARIRAAGTDLDLGNRGVLAEPVGYENALGLLAAMGIVLALSVRGAAPLRAGALVPLAAVLAATGNRGAWLALAAGLLVVAAFEPTSIRLAGALVCGAAAAALAAWTPTLEPDIAPTRAEAGVLPLVLGLVALTVAAIALTAAQQRTSRLFAPLRVSRRRATLALALLPPLVVAALVGAGSQRRSYWSAALDQAAGAPLFGDGAGSFARHWLATRDVPFDVRDAHSLYFETLGELGFVGLALLVIALVSPLRLASREPAAAAALVAFLVHAAFDWDWEMPTLTLAAIFCAAALANRGGSQVTVATPHRLVAAAALVVVGALALPPFIGHATFAAADDAFRDGREAASLAGTNRTQQFLPWSPEPHLLAALVYRQRGAGSAARAEIIRALSHDEADARLWRVLAELSAGEERRRALERAEELDPLGAPASS